jgi:uncharacterized protein YbaP (TraB family)
MSTVEDLHQEMIESWLNGNQTWFYEEYRAMTPFAKEQFVNALSENGENDIIQFLLLKSI